MDPLRSCAYADPSKTPWSIGWLMAPANLAQPSPGAPQLMMSNELAAEDRKTIISR
ncbi:uncharacterized protein PgNI_02934 [Pyricularia grisea]|uniref:Uncharacterized protein n=1 Tax=Pyricularia grisea TaxID=148305 RepID=A0A6P8BCL3_PYRGI|nr:uncharacterized protein PgNI_02934 [Pyricularia grisea]TLD13611.1 hypothetical protein PgNI_02934 [Pyricularia grisea]